MRYTISGFDTKRKNFSSREGRSWKWKDSISRGEGKLAGKKLQRELEQSKYLEESTVWRKLEHDGNGRISIYSSSKNIGEDSIDPWIFVAVYTICVLG